MIWGQYSAKMCSNVKKSSAIGYPFVKLKPATPFYSLLLNPLAGGMGCVQRCYNARSRHRGVADLQHCRGLRQHTWPLAMAQAAFSLARPLTALPPHGPGKPCGLGMLPALVYFMEAFLVSTGAVALGEMGDKTQLLAMLLAAKYRRPLPIILGILVATLANHAAAGAVGEWIAQLVSPDVIRWVIGGSFIAMAVWMMIPDKVDEEEVSRTPFALGVFGTTVIAFFMAEMGDKTQIATVALAARYSEFVAVVAGTTLGMMIANVPAVYLGHKVADRIPMTLVHGIAALIFAVLGVLTLFNVGGLF